MSDENYVQNSDRKQFNYNGSFGEMKKIEISFGEALSKSKESEPKVSLASKQSDPKISLAKSSSAFKMKNNVYEDDEIIDDFYHSSR